MKATKARRGAGRTPDPGSATDPFPQPREAQGGKARSSSRRPARRATSSERADQPSTTSEAGPPEPMWPGLTAAEVPTEVPRIDDVLRTPLRTPPGSPQPHAHARIAAPAPPATADDGDDGTEAAPVAERPAPSPKGSAGSRKGSAALRRGSAALRTGSAVRRLGRARAVRGVWARAPMLAATGAVALLAGVASGLGYDVVSGLGADEEAPLPTTPETCAVAQVAWARSANAQVGMSTDNPETLVKGFVGAREALVGVQPPPAIAGDWSVVVGYVDEVAKSVDDVKEDSEIEGAVVEALRRLDTAGMTDAAQRITTYLKADCEP